MSTAYVKVGRKVSVCRAFLTDTVGTPNRMARKLSSLKPLFVMEGGFSEEGQAQVLAAGALIRFRAIGSEVEIRCHDGQVLQFPSSYSPEEQLVNLRSLLDFGDQDVPELLSGTMGFLSYNAVRGFEHLPQPDERPASLPDYDFFIPQVSMRFMETGVEVLLLSLHGMEHAESLLEKVKSLLQRPLVKDSATGLTIRSQEYQASYTQQQYEEAVGRAKEYILSGDIFQVVLSVRLNMEVEGDPILTYEKLKSVNPSPFQYCFVSEEYQVVGASPEPLVMVNGKRCEIRPLAGTAKRGVTTEEDECRAQELQASEKDRAEHRMLVDLARNDLGRVCSIGTVEVEQLMEVERYSHVMHLVSNVAGRLQDDKGIVDVLRACFPAGTMAGAPKIRAMEIIDELEPISRDFYSGGVGVLHGDKLSLYITIRSLIVQDGLMSMQAGAGIVYDSDPASEYVECLNKLRALMAVVGWKEAVR